MTTEREDAAGATVRVDLLGGFAMRVAGHAIDPEAWRLGKARSLVKLLLLAPQQALPRDQALDLLWPDFAPEAAQNNLYTTLAAVRRVLAPAGTVRLRDGVLALETALPLTVDVRLFEEAARRALGTHDLAAHEAALALYTGDLLPEDRYEEWTLARRESLRATQQQLRFALAKLQQEQGAEAAAINTLQQIVADDPVLEEAHLSLMRLHAASGRRVAAIRQYQALRAALEAQLDTEPSAEVRRLYAEIVINREAPRREAPPQRVEAASPRPKHNLPLALSSFVGRQREVTAIVDLITGRGQRVAAAPPPRLVALIGIGGMGKTRLALAAAEAAAADFPDGVWFVDLAPLRDGALVVGAVANALGVRERADQTLLATLCEAIGARATLVVLDNCEHLLPVVRETVEALLRGCPRCQILATSRERLQVAGEVDWTVPPLATPPDSAADQGPEALAQIAAVDLFLSRVRERQPQFVLTHENASAVAAICRRLDGLPLALELAAARTAVLTMRQLADRLDRALGLLATRERALPERQQTLRATLDWSHALLPPEAQRLMARLSVFDGGCTLAAIEAVADADDLVVLDSLHTLDELSLIQRHETAAGEARFRMLELVREYAHERLAASGEEAAVRERHADYYLRLAESAPRLAEVAWQRSMLAEEGNLRGALRWAAANRDGDLGLRLVNALVPYWANRGAYREGHGWIDAFLTLAAALPEESVPALLLAHTLHGATLLAWQGGDAAGARRYGEQALGHYRLLDDRHDIARILRLLANVALIDGQYTTMAGLLDEAEGILRTLGARDDLAMVLNTRGELLRTVYGDYARAEAHYREALALLRVTGTVQWQATLLGNLAAVLLRRGASDEALAALRESLEIRLNLQNRRGIAICLELYGALAVVLGRYAQAATFYAAAEQLRLAINSPRTSDPADEAEHQHYLALARAAIQPSSWDAAWAQGRSLSPEQATAEALAMPGEAARPD